MRRWLRFAPVTALLLGSLLLSGVALVNLTGLFLQRAFEDRREVATRLATQTFVGAARLLQDSGDSPQTLRKRVSSKGGTTLAALEAMASAGLQDVVSAGARAAAARSKEMGEELGNP